MTSPITLEEVDPESEWITEATDPIFDDEDLEWADEAEREAETVAMAAKEHRALVVPSGTSQALAETTIDPRGTSQAETMANHSSKTYLRCLTRRHIIDYSEAKDEDEDEDEDQKPQLQTCFNFLFKT